MYFINCLIAILMTQLCYFSDVLPFGLGSDLSFPGPALTRGGFLSGCGYDDSVCADWVY